MNHCQRAGLRMIMSRVSLACLVLLFFSLEASGGWLEQGSKLLGSMPQGVSNKKEPSTGDMSKAFKEALQIGSERVVGKLGKADGFNADPAIHIPLPAQLDTVKTVLGKAGMSGLLDDLELKMNRAAEAAAPRAKKLFLQAISEMTFQDVKTIYSGPEDSATRYFREKLTTSLTKDMTPIVDASLSQVGAVQAYDGAMGRYKAIPFVPDAKANLTQHVTEKGIAGIFYYLAKEEAAIRQNPARQTTDLLKRVFGK
ncbi:MAG: DUF4197 domain-containing protein [Desulfobulbaceae bacterium]|nr:DUF4197 domain-containing protein [Desulfobulbaceae bacterium]